MSTIGFANPWLLAALASLPVLWWLLRVTPPAARRQEFPAIALLFGLEMSVPSAARTPWWLLLMRLAAAALVIVSLAGPVRRAPAAMMTAGPLLMVLDDGWAAAADWPERLRAAAAASMSAAPAAPAHLLLTAPAPDGTPPALSPALTAADLPARLAAQHPTPWPTDRAAAAAALIRLPPATTVIYIADGVASADPAGDTAFAAVLGRFAAVIELRGTSPPRLLRPAAPRTDGFDARADTLAGDRGGAAVVQAIDAAGATLADLPLVATGDGSLTGRLILPPVLRNRAVALRLAGPAAAGSLALLDETTRRRPVGVPSRGAATDEPLTGVLFYVRRALSQGAELREGDLATLLTRDISVIVLADPPLTDPDQIAALSAWVRNGGLLLRFAGQSLAAAVNDPLLPVTLLAGDRALGGAMSWTRPARLAPFAPASPFTGLPLSGEITISRQVLAQPGDAPDRPGRQDWATLEDGTPLVTSAPFGAGRLVLFHVTANAAWSNLPLSGLFPEMLRRIVALSVGVTPLADATPLAPRRLLDGYGQLGPPGSAAQPLTAEALATTRADPRHPPGLYGPPGGGRAFNLGAGLGSLRAMPPVAGAVLRSLDGTMAARQAYGPALLAAALTLLAIDGLVTLGLRGMLVPAVFSILVVMPLGARAAGSDLPSLATHLAYIQTGDAQADGISRAGLQGLSDYVGARTAAQLADPVGVDPAQDDLSFYPMLYWPILPDAPTPGGTALARLEAYMDNGGILVIDTRDGDGDDGAQAALRRIGTALGLPVLTPLTFQHVLSHTFYLLHDWPGRTDGSAVWVASGDNRANDDVSSVIIGGSDWAAAWAVDDQGGHPYEATPGGENQRMLAYRFGVNLVMYSLTGSYKADQLHAPELLRRMGGQP